MVIVFPRVDASFFSDDFERSWPAFVVGARAFRHLFELFLGQELGGGDLIPIEN
jgi:hypothetical protein